MPRSLPKRSFLFGLAALSLAGTRAAWAQAPTGTVKLVVPFTPGASHDLIGRMVAEGMGRRTGRNWIVENRAGAGSQMGTDHVAKAPPDGATLLLAATAGLGTLPAIKPVMPYAVDRDFTYLARLATSPYALVVHPQVAAASLAEFVRLAKSKPGAIRVGTVGVGSLDYMGVELMQSQLGIEVNIVPYKGMAPVLNDVRAGHIDALLVSPATVAPTVQEGKLRALAVFDARRSRVLPEVPTTAEAGHPDLVVGSWWGVVGPARLPAAQTQALRQELQALLADPAFRKSLEDRGFDVAPLAGDAFAQFVAKDLERWRAVARKANITLTE